MTNIKIDREQLLSDRRVVEEIQRHLWVESEKAGYDIGFEKAKEDWLRNFSKAWLSYHMPETLTASRKSHPKKSSPRKSKPKKSSSARNRNAKSYHE